MGQTTFTWLTPLLVAVIPAVITWLIAARKTSGRIRDTEAAKLWDEASSLRAVYQAEIERLRLDIEAEREVRLRLEVEARERTIELNLLQGKVDRLARENAQLTARVAELENGRAQTP